VPVGHDADRGRPVAVAVADLDAGVVLCPLAVREIASRDDQFVLPVSPVRRVLAAVLGPQPRGKRRRVRLCMPDPRRSVPTGSAAGRPAPSRSRRLPPFGSLRSRARAPTRRSTRRCRKALSVDPPTGPSCSVLVPPARHSGRICGRHSCVLPISE
jgi:hypothetical protein